MPEILSCIPLKNGRNNQVFKLEIVHNTRKESVLLKRYFRHPKDPRPRLESEFSFLLFASQLGLHCVAKPLISHPKANWGLYSFLPGAPVKTATPDGVEAAMQFLEALNLHKEQGRFLAPASEACFVFTDYFDGVEKRLKKLQASRNEVVKNIVQKEFFPKWEKIKAKSSLLIFTPLKKEETLITPSDFGFHNALVHKGKYFFLDFEYAGWDDPAKTACDFFCQPQVPVPMDVFESTCRRIASLAAHPERCMERIYALLPVCRMKWGCLMLSRFTDTGQARRSFAQCEENQQIEKTREYLVSTLE